MTPSAAPKAFKYSSIIANAGCCEKTLFTTDSVAAADRKTLDDSISAGTKHAPDEISRVMM